MISFLQTEGQTEGSTGITRSPPQPHFWHTRPFLGQDPITFSLMKAQMIRVISSPSISTTGFATLIRLSASGEQWAC